MGTTFRLVLYASNEDQADHAARAAFARVEALNGIFSDYDETSELCRLSAAAGRGPRPVSAELWSVLQAAQELARRTGGAFDVTLGPYVRLWRRSARQAELPASARLAGAARAVGFQRLRLDAERRTVVLEVPDMRLDLGGIAKGATLDLVLEELARHGIERALVDGGGDLRLGAPPPHRSAWRVTVEGADGLRLELAHCAVATSGDRARSVVIAGERYSHIIDPATGLGSTRRAQATVVAPDALRADALATALCIMDLREGSALIESLPGIESRVVVSSGGGPVTCDSSGFARTMPLCPPRSHQEPLR
jgi:thiamine biosynthesis lipoprotein